MSATETTVRLFKGIGLTVIGVFIAMGGLALVLFQRQWLGLVPLIAGGYMVARARPSIVRGLEVNPYDDPLFMDIPERSKCKRCNAPSLDKWRTLCVICEWQPGDSVDVASGRADLAGTTREEQQLRARLLRLYERTDAEPDEERQALWQEIVAAERELSGLYAERIRKRVRQ
jgi:hypothetical protein